MFSENETVELKSRYVDDIKKEIVAFANTSGGTIYVGVENDGTVCGTDDPDFIIQQITNTVRDSVKPDVTMFIHYEIKEIDSKKIIEIEVQCGAHKPYYIASKGLRPEGVYVRQGTSSVPASDMLIRQMIKETDGDNYEDLRSLNQSLTFKKVKEEFEKRNLKFEDAQMKTLGIIDNDGLYSNLALLLSDQCPHIIKAATFNGVDGQNFHDRCEFTGSLLQQLEDAYAYMQLRNNIKATFEGLLRIDHPSYPEKALREALLNAVVHRDYAISASTLLTVYDDRMEIVSIGGLAGNMSYEDMMLGVSLCRNKKLADIFYRLQLIESYGTGIAKIMSSYNKSDLHPEIKVTSGAFKIMLPNNNFEDKTKSENVMHISSKDKENQLIELFKNRGELTRAEIEIDLQISTSTARRLIQNLEIGGQIKIIGKGKNTKYIFAEQEG